MPPLLPAPPLLFLALPSLLRAGTSLLFFFFFFLSPPPPKLPLLSVRCLPADDGDDDRFFFFFLAAPDEDEPPPPPPPLEGVLPCDDGAASGLGVLGLACGVATAAGTVAALEICASWLWIFIICSCRLWIILESLEGSADAAGAGDAAAPPPELRRSFLDLGVFSLPCLCFLSFFFLSFFTMGACSLSLLSLPSSLSSSISESSPPLSPGCSGGKLGICASLFSNVFCTRAAIWLTSACSPLYLRKRRDADEDPERARGRGRGRGGRAYKTRRQSRGWRAHPATGGPHIPEAVGEDEAHIRGELLGVAVLAALQLGPHSAQVHRLLDDLDPAKVPSRCKRRQLLVRASETGPGSVTHVGTVRARSRERDGSEVGHSGARPPPTSQPSPPSPPHSQPSPPSLPASLPTPPRLPPNRSLTVK